MNELRVFSDLTQVFIFCNRRMIDDNNNIIINNNNSGKAEMTQYAHQLFMNFMRALLNRSGAVLADHARETDGSGHS